LTYIYPDEFLTGAHTNPAKTYPHLTGDLWARGPMHGLSTSIYCQSFKAKDLKIEKYRGYSPYLFILSTAVL
jgi:hypothetical protein